MIHLEEVAAFLDAVLGAEQFSDDPNGLLRSSAHAVTRIGLALEPFPELGLRLAQENADALLLHRPWKLLTDQVPPHIGILAYHLSFDEHLTMGYNPRLAQTLRATRLEPFGEKNGRPLGMTGDVPAGRFPVFQALVRSVFGGLADTYANFRQDVHRIAVVGAMNETLIRNAAAQGVDVYLTGQFRKEAAKAVIDTGISVITVGHRRSEQWGLRTLQYILRERWAELDVVILGE